MRWLIGTLFLFAVAVVVALVARVNHGNVVVLWPPYRMDVSVNVALLCILVGFLVFHFLLLALAKAFDLPGRVRRFREGRRAQRADQNLREAFTALMEGRFGRAERLATESMHEPKNQGMASLIGARAAHRMREPARRDQWMERAPVAQNAANLMLRAEFALEDQSPDRALEAVQQLHASGARHIQAIRMSLRANEKAERWSEVLRLVSVLERRDALHPAVLEKSRRVAVAGLLDKNSQDAGALARLRKELPSALLRDEAIAPRLFSALVNVGDVGGAREVAVAALDREYCEALVRPYASLKSVDASERLANLERWSKKYQDPVVLVFALGELCMEQSLWGKAQAMLDSAHLRAPSVSTHVALADLATRLGKGELATKHYQSAAKLAAA
jgi:HemY protein